MSFESVTPTKRTLDSGLRVIALELPNVHRTAISAFLKVGSRFESTADNGISHFLEHMLYRGTPRHPSAYEQALAFERLGGTLVAATGPDSGSMKIALPTENLDAVLPLFAEVYAEPVFDGLEVERGIVREEILEDLDEHGKQVDADNLLRDLAFEGHALGYPITGTLDHLDRFTVEALRAHHRKHYVAHNTVLVACGPLPSEALLDRLERHFGSLPRGRAPLSEPPPEQTEARCRFVRHSSSQTQIRVAFRAPSALSPSEPAVELLLRVLDDGMATRLYRRLCDEKGLCYDVSASYEAYEDSGLLDLAAETAHDQAPEVVGELIDVVVRLRDEGPTGDELDKAKARHRWNLVEMLDDPDDIAELTGELALLGCDRSFAQRRAQIDAVTSAEVRDAAQAVFRREALSTVAVGLLPKRARDAISRQVHQFS